MVLDWYTKEIVGWNLSLRAKSSEWKEALDGALCEKFPWGVRDQGLNFVSDNSQPTSVAFMKDTAELGIDQIFCSYDNPRGNAETERVIRTIKEECLWLNEFSSFEEARATIEAWIGEDYNRLYVHSALGYRSPEEFRRQWIQSQEVVLGGCWDMDRVEIAAYRLNAQDILFDSSSNSQIEKKCLDFRGSLQNQKDESYPV